jgi:hypothetical protein
VVDRKKIHSDIKKLQRVKTWHLVVLLILSSFLAATFLRLNNIGMIERRNAVISADEVGNKEITKDRLYDLQRYVSSHMNTNLGKGVYLESSYKRDTQAAYEAVESDSNVYRLVQEYCMPRFSNWSQAYVQCVANRLSEYPETELPKLPNTSAYLHSFVSPLWSPDFAGWSLLICAILLVAIIFRITGYFVLKTILKRRYPTI